MGAVHCDKLKDVEAKRLCVEQLMLYAQTEVQFFLRIGKGGKGKGRLSINISLPLCRTT